MVYRPRLYESQDVNCFLDLFDRIFFMKNISQIDFDLQSLFAAWGNLVDASNELNSDLFRYDLVDITKEVLQYKFASTYTQLMLAYNQSDLYGVGYERNKSFDFSI